MGSYWGWVGILRDVSKWWKEISLSGSSQPGFIDWFFESILMKVRDGQSTYFWKDLWLGDIPLRIRFLRLFQVSIDDRSSYVILSMFFCQFQ